MESSGLMEHPVRKDRKAPPGLKAIRAKRGNRAVSVCRAHPVIRAPSAIKVRLATGVRREMRDHKDHRGLPAFKVIKDRLETRVRRATRAYSEPLVQMD